MDWRAEGTSARGSCRETRSWGSKVWRSWLATLGRRKSHPAHVHRRVPLQSHLPMRDTAGSWSRFCGWRHRRPAANQTSPAKQPGTRRQQHRREEGLPFLSHASRMGWQLHN